MEGSLFAPLSLRRIAVQVNATRHLPMIKPPDLPKHRLLHCHRLSFHQRHEAQTLALDHSNILRAQGPLSCTDKKPIKPPIHTAKASPCSNLPPPFTFYNRESETIRAVRKYFYQAQNCPIMFSVPFATYIASNKVDLPHRTLRS